MSSAITKAVRWPLGAFKRRLWKIGPVATNPYATHVPVLVACSLLFRPKRVIELGSGHYSTSLFINKSVFPDVVEVKSIENDAEWFGKLEYLKDTRLERVLVKGPMFEAMRDLDCSGFDLIFVDDSSSAADRKKTLDTLRPRVGNSQIVVIHDYELWPIRLATHSYSKHHGMHGLTPQCAIAWNHGSVASEKLKKVNQILRDHRGQIREEDALGWRNQFVESIDLTR